MDKVILITIILLFRGYIISVIHAFRRTDYFRHIKSTYLPSFSLLIIPNDFERNFYQIIYKNIDAKSQLAYFKSESFNNSEIYPFWSFYLLVPSENQKISKPQTID